MLEPSPATRLKIMRAMLLAAGRGERLRPLTDRIPKPLIEINGKTLIERHVQAISRSGISEIVVNLSWLGDHIRDFLEDGSRWNVRISYSPEPPGALETAGGIRRALPLLDDDCFLVVSADVLTDYDYARLVNQQPSGLAHLVMVDNPAHHAGGDFSLTADGVVQAGEQDRLTYAGVGLFRSRMFADLDPDVTLPLRPLLNEAIRAGRVSGEHYQGRWMDIGTRQRLDAARQEGW